MQQTDQPKSGANAGLQQPQYLDALHIAALYQLAVAQPIFDILTKHSTFFVARRSEPVDVYTMTALVACAAPLLLAPSHAVRRNTRHTSEKQAHNRGIGFFIGISSHILQASSNMLIPAVFSAASGRHKHVITASGGRKNCG